ncbi:MAG: DNA gyrase subunit A [Clostridiales bacterium]|nr:DNA gyrase subunit A [Clostridiales bacterium]MCF8021518.1 DNA gyrase subunit A [Clostridiales bacterium]
MTEKIGNVIPIDINREMRHSYLDYAMSVIVGRALPDVRDGLKPVHRRILYAMNNLGVSPEKSHRKSAYIVGEVMAKYHPHGDVAIYDTLVRLAQDFSCRYPLVDGHGNFGSIDGDSAAAMRYTEARMASISTELLSDIDKNTVDFLPNYDETEKEPEVLPSRVPNLLINGSAGIAVGMATNIPPHNLGEVIDGIIKLIDNPDLEIDQLMECIKGPDFPTGGTILGKEGINNAYYNGRGTIRIRAKSNIELTGKKQQIIVTEIPYQVNKAKLIEKIADLVKNKKVEGISDLRDESDREGMRIVIELKKEANPHVILNQLYKYTQLQDSFGVIMLALVNGQPEVLNLKQMLFHYLQHQKNIIIRRSEYELNKAEARAHIVEGLKVALDNLDEVIEIIRSSNTVDIARNSLMNRFEFTHKQAQAILDMRLQRLTGMERKKLEEEYSELLGKINYLKEILADENKILGVVKKELVDLKKKYNDLRCSEISNESYSLEEEDLIIQEDVVITITNKGYIKRMPLSTYKSQKRGGRGIHAAGIKQQDFLQHLFITSTHHHFLFFSNKGKVYRLKVHEIPEAGRQARGTAIINLLQVETDEDITAVIPVKDFAPKSYLLMSTKMGIIKKTSLNQYNTSKKDGLIAIKLDDNDELVNVTLTDGNQEIILATKNGKAVRFCEEEVRSVGRVSRGIKGITLKNEDCVVSMDILRKDGDVLVVTRQGYGKRSRIKDYRVQSRGGIGIRNIKNNPRNGYVVSVHIIKKDEELMLISAEGIMIRIKAGDVPLMSRSTQGVILMKLSEHDHVVAVARVVNNE